MTPPKEPEPALAAPGIIGANSIERPSVLGAPTGPRSNRRARNRSYSHVHLELDLAPKPKTPAKDALLERLVGWLTAREIVEQGTLIVLAATALHALAASGFRRVEQWDVAPGGWLSTPSVSKDPDSDEPVGHLLDALEADGGKSVGSADTFSARLSDHRGNHVALVVRRVHSGRGHALSLDLHGDWTRAAVKGLTGSIAERLPVVRTTMTKFQYA